MHVSKDSMGWMKKNFRCECARVKSSNIVTCTHVACHVVNYNAFLFEFG